MGSNPKILPRTLLPKSDPESPSSPSIENVRERGEPPSKKQRKCISNACMPCRKRKSKCDGERPNCTACTTVYSTECIYDLDADHRRKGALKRDIAELTESNRKIGLVIDAIRKRSEADVDDIIQLIRSEADLSHDEIAEKIESLGSVKQPEITDDQPTQPTSLEGELVIDLRKGSIDKSSEGRHYGMTSNLGLQTEDLKAVAVDQIGAWTTVTNDSEFIDHLLNLYFTWSHPWYMMFPEEVFYHGMEQRKSKYCTPLLMNALLAFGCQFSDRPQARTDPNDPKTAGEHFFTEARRLLYQDENHPSMTTVQALGVMSLRQVINNNDSSGRRYAAQMMSMVTELGLHTSAAAQNTKLTPTEIEARRVTFWGCFVLDIGWAICAGRISFLPRNAICLEKQALSENLEQKLWPPQGGLDDNLASIPTLPQPSHKYGILLQVSLLSEILDDIIHMFYAPRDRITSRRLQLHHEKLQTWYRNLPVELAMKESGSTLPQIITLHIYYHNCALVLFRPYLNWAFVQQMSKTPRQICTESANAISELTNIYVDTYGAKRLFSINTHSIMSAAIIHLANLNRPNPNPNQERYLITSIKAMNEMSKVFRICVRFCSILHHNILTWCKNGIPASVQQALDEIEPERPSSAMVSPTTITAPRPPVNSNTPSNRTNSVGSSSSVTSNTYPPYRPNSFSRKPSAPEIMQMAPPSMMTANPFSSQRQMQNGFFNPLGGFEGVPVPVQSNAGNAGPMGISGILDGEFPDWNKDGFILEQQGAVDFSWDFAGARFRG